MSGEARRFTCAETAKLLREALKEAFPGVAFSVRSKVYSGGASISVRWADGPRAARVKPVTDRFERATFDGMTDSKSYRTGEWKGERVSFGSDFVFVSRQLTDESAKVAAAAVLIRDRCHLEEGERFGGRYLPELAAATARDWDASEPGLEPAFRRVVLMESGA